MRPSTEQFLPPAIDPRTAEEFVRFTGELAAAAAAVTLPAFRRPHDVEDKGDKNGFDPVTMADRQAEQAMRKLIESRYPDHGIIGEEFSNRDGNSPYSWILDPIDGTRGYVAGIPAWTTLIGLTHKGMPFLGSISQPFTGERFVGIETATTCKAWHEQGNRRTDMKASACPSLESALLTSTSPELFTGEETALFEKTRRRVRLTRYGLDAYGYGLLAFGTIDLVIESGLQAYDIQPLIPVIRGAGAVVTDWQGGLPLDGGRILAAATPALHAEALDSLSA